MSESLRRLCFTMSLYLLTTKRKGIKQELNETIRLQEMLVSEIVGKSKIKEETLRDYISGKAEWYIPATEAITLKLADKYYK